MKAACRERLELFQEKCKAVFRPELRKTNEIEHRHDSEKNGSALVRRDVDGGFLLVEVLATMTISAFLLIALVSVMSLTMRASGRVGQESQSAESLNRIMATLNREISQIAPIRWAGPDAGFVFSGTSQALVFARDSRDADGAVDHEIIALQADRQQLFRRKVQLLPAARSFTEVDLRGPPDLVETRYDVRFAYFSRLNNGTEALVDVWTEVTKLPVAVQIKLTDANGTERASTRVAVRVDAESGCAAPEKAVCSLFDRPPVTDGEIQKPQASVDPNDDLGWLRYGK